MHLYLIGYRGSGKTTIARALSERLGLPWMDTDDWIEQKAGKTIRDLFAQQGEDAFRYLETVAIETASLRPPSVIALGGGAILREENRRQLRETGRTVWLQASPEALAARIAQDPSTSTRRPGLTAAGPIDEIKAVLEVRTPLYREAADLELETAGLDVDSITERIATWWLAGAHQ